MTKATTQFRVVVGARVITVDQTGLRQLLVGSPHSLSQRVARITAAAPAVPALRQAA